MSCRIERIAAGHQIVLRVSGWIHAEHVDTLRKLVEREKGNVAIDLKEVTMVNRDGVKLLALTEGNGTELRNCPAYVREWISREGIGTDGGPFVAPDPDTE